MSSPAEILSFFINLRSQRVRQAENAARQARFEQSLPLERQRISQEAARLGMQARGRDVPPDVAAAATSSFGGTPEIAELVRQTSALRAEQQLRILTKEAEGLSSLLFLANEAKQPGAAETIGPKIAQLTQEFGAEKAGRVVSLAEANFRNLVRKEQVQRSREERRDARAMAAEERRREQSKESPSTKKQRQLGNMLFDRFLQADVPFETFIQQGFRTKTNTVTGQQEPIPLKNEEIIALENNEGFVEMRNRQQAAFKQLGLGSLGLPLRPSARQPSAEPRVPAGAVPVTDPVERDLVEGLRAAGVDLTSEEAQLQLRRNVPELRRGQRREIEVEGVGTVKIRRKR